MTDLKGENLTIALSDGPDMGGPYENSVGVATLTIFGDGDLELWPEATEAANAISQDGGQIAVDIGNGFTAGLITLTLLGQDNYTGGTFLDDALLISDNAQALGNADLVFNGFGAFEAGVSQTLNLLSLAANVTAVLAAADDAVLTVSGPVVFDGGAQTEFIFGFYDENLSFDSQVSAAGEILLDPSGVGTNFFGSIDIANGDLILGNAAAAALISSAQGGISIGNGDDDLVTLDLFGENVIAYNLNGKFGAIITDGVGGASSVLTVDNTADSSYSGVIKNGLGLVALVVDANDFIFTMDGDNTFSGGTTINSGALEILHGTELGSGAVNFDGVAGATLIADGGFNLANTLAVTANTSATIEESDDNASISLGAPGANGFTVGAGATVHFGGPNATGAVYLDLVTSQTVGAGATLDVDGGFLLPQDALAATFMGQFASVAIGTDLATFAVIDLDGFSLTLNNLSGDVRGNIQNDSATAATLTLNNTTDTTFDGNIHGAPQGQSFGALSVVISGNSVLTFTDDETYIGGTTIDSGATLNLGVDNTGHSGTLLGNVTDNGILELNWSLGLFQDFQGIISGAGKVEIGANDVVELSGHNSFQGGLFLEAGATLDVGALGAAGSGTIDFSGRGDELRFAHDALSTATLERLAGLAAGDCIDLLGLAASSAVIQAGKLFVLEGQKKVAEFQLVGSVAGPQVSTLQTSKGTIVYVDANVASYAAQKSQLDLAINGFAVYDVAANLATHISQLSADPNVALIVVADNTAVTMSAAEALSVLAKLRNANGSAGLVAISDTAADIAQSIDALAPEFARISSIVFKDATPTPVINLTKAQKNADGAVLQEIASPWILEVHNPNQSIAQIGHGDGLTITAIAGVDSIVGGGNDEIFQIGQGFGSVTLVDLAAHLTGVGHDFVNLSKSEFASFHAVLKDTTVSGFNLVISAGGDTLTLDNMTISQLESADAHFKFF